MRRITGMLIGIMTVLGTILISTSAAEAAPKHRIIIVSNPGTCSFYYNAQVIRFKDTFSGQGYLCFIRL